MRVPWELRRLRAALDKADHKVAALAEADEKDSIFNWVLLHRVWGSAIFFAPQQKDPKLLLRDQGTIT
eukprot:Cvel_29528.t1-p1 / transcript=Cvel_29528.t1 / gene=Cvel_29528 / organism=Chromera_velia_CCMP2878 / gene_product=hypothetical protein / transcript_product=hypothetical protein / location=Cvel_scaffold4056:223-423(-) / protein_length=67 / sequence_SO=supercontig / SO=protein_coding / is_pseudo=false